MNPTARISIVIPVYNEQERIARCIENAFTACVNPHEIIVVDGAADGSTINRISDDRVLAIHSAAGRAVQMNAGAEAASGEILLFLHADTTLPDGASTLVREALDAPASTAGAFKLSFDKDSPILKFIAFIADLRARIERIPYGDQAVFIYKDTFNRLGGFPEIPLMEDVEFFRKIKKERREIVILKEEIKTSARRYENGPLRRALRNTMIRILHLCGAGPSFLARIYN